MVVRPFWLILLAPFLGCTALHRAQTTFELTAEHVADAPIFVESSNGGVEVRVEPSLAHIEVTGTVTATAPAQDEAQARLDEIEVVAVRRDDGTLDVHAHFPEGRRSSEGCSFVVRTPSARGVTIRTSNGRITLDGTAGSADVKTSNGTVTVRGHRGDARIGTSNGAVTVEDAAGAVDVDTSNGSIHVDSVPGPAVVRTSNGRIEFTAGPDYAEALDLRTSNGSITVRLPGSPRARLETSTSNGSVVVTDDGGACQVDGSRTSKTVVVGGGAAPSSIRTSNGSIRILVAGASG